MGESKRRSYTEGERDAAVADVPALGVIGAAKKHGAPQSCVSKWAKDAGVRREVGAPPARQATRGRKGKVAASEDKTKRATPTPEPKRESSGSEPEAVVAAIESAREEPAPTVPASKPEAAQPPVRRRLKSRVAKIYTPSQKGEILEHAGTHGPTETGKKFGVSRYSIYAWQRKVSNAAEGNGPSPTSGPAPAGAKPARS